MRTISNGGSTYQILGVLAKNEAFNLYECRIPGDKPGILKIATNQGWNFELENEAEILRHLEKGAQALDERARRDHSKVGSYGYQKMFLHPFDCFTSGEDQGHRTVLILDCSESAQKLSDLSPLRRIMTHDHLRIDPKTSVWIMGKLLKLIAFAHDHGVTVHIHGENILVNREQHIVTLYDWSSSSVPNGFDESITDDADDEAVSKAAIEVIRALGGDVETGELLPDPQLKDAWYEELLWSIANGDYDTAAGAHTAFYDQVRSVWPKGFHKFAGYPVSESEEETTIEEEGE